MVLTTWMTEIPKKMADEAAPEHATADPTTHSATPDHAAFWAEFLAEPNALEGGSHFWTELRAIIPKWQRGTDNIDGAKLKSALAAALEEYCLEIMPIYQAYVSEKYPLAKLELGWMLDRRALRSVPPIVTALFAGDDAFGQRLWARLNEKCGNSEGCQFDGLILPIGRHLEKVG